MTFRATGRVLREVNDATGGRWRLGPELTGGFQGGAWRLDGPDGPAVLKWWDQAEPAARVLAAAPVVAEVRAQGYPTPAWLAVGTIPSGLPYVVQELVGGCAPEGLSLRDAQLVRDLVRLQRRIRPTTKVDWARVVHEDVFVDPRDVQPRLRALGEPVREAVDSAMRLARPHTAVRLPADELVHGDLGVANILRDRTRVHGVVDIDGLGRGPAVYDLLMPARQSRIWGGDAAAITLLEREALETYDAGAVPMAAACSVLAILRFGADNWPHDVGWVAQRCTRWTESLAGRIGVR